MEKRVGGFYLKFNHLKQNLSICLQINQICCMLHMYKDMAIKELLQIREIVEEMTKLKWKRNPFTELIKLQATNRLLQRWENILITQP